MNNLQAFLFFAGQISDRFLKNCPVPAYAYRAESCSKPAWSSSRPFKYKIITFKDRMNLIGLRTVAIGIKSINSLFSLLLVSLQCEIPVPAFIFICPARIRGSLLYGWLWPKRRPDSTDKPARWFPSGGRWLQGLLPIPYLWFLFRLYKAFTPPNFSGCSDSLFNGLGWCVSFFLLSFSFFFLLAAAQNRLIGPFLSAA